VGGRPPRISLSSAVFGAEAATKRATHNDTAPTVSEPFLDFSYDLSPIMMTGARVCCGSCVRWLAALRSVCWLLQKHALHPHPHS
jgi:hypothetical protein